MGDGLCLWRKLIIDYDLVFDRIDGLNNKKDHLKSYIIYNYDCCKVYYVQKCCINNKYIFCG